MTAGSDCVFDVAPSEPGTYAAAVPLRLEAGAVVTLLAECYDADVALSVADAFAAELAADDDSGRETNACLVFEAPAAGTYSLRIRAKDGTGKARLFALRGRADLTIVDPALSARGYWELASSLARTRNDGARLREANAHLEALGVAQDSAAARERNAAVAAADEAIASARGFLKAHRLDEARSQIRSAAERLAGVVGAETDGFVQDRLWLLAPIALAAEDYATARDAFTAAADYRERTMPLDHPAAAIARASAGAARQRCGDAAGASAFLEEARAALVPRLRADHPLLLQLERDLAAAATATGQR